ncbi:MAG: hypothetical protein ACOCRK_08585 [bacterium]
MKKKFLFILFIMLILIFSISYEIETVKEINPNDLPTNLTESEIKELDNLEPEDLKERITLVGDLLNYLRAHYERSGGNIKIGENKSWQILEPAESVIETKTANCAGAANLAAYLLENNYDEVGYIHEHSGYVNTDSPGGHVISYVKDGNDYIAFDPQQAIVTDTYVFQDNDIEVLAAYYAEEFKPRYSDRNIALVNVIKGEGFHAVKTHSGGANYEKIDENMRIHYPDYYKNRAWTAWEDPDDPLFLEFGKGPDSTPQEYRAYFREDKDHYLHTPEIKPKHIGIAAGIGILVYLIQ